MKALASALRRLAERLDPSRPVEGYSWSSASFPASLLLRFGEKGVFGRENPTTGFHPRKARYYENS